jgi:hypothetical protein
MTPPGGKALLSKLIEVRENEIFADETVVGDVVVVVTHRIRRLTDDRTAIIYSATVTGPDAQEIGKLVTADFPDVLAALAALAESLPSSSTSPMATTSWSS